MRNVIYDAIREANSFIKWYSVFEIRFSFPLGMCPAGSHGRSVLNFLRNLHIIFSSGWTKLPSHQQCVEFFFFPQHPHQYLFYLVLIAMIAILRGVRWYVILALICILLIISEAEHHFMCLLVILLSSLGKCLYNPSVCLLNQNFFLNLYEFFMYFE